MKPDRVVRILAGLLFAFGVVSATIRTTQEPSKTQELIAAVRDTLAKDSMVPKDTIFLESGLTLDPRKSDSAKVSYLTKIGYFDTVRVSTCTIVLVPKSINRLVSEYLKNNADSLITVEAIRKLTP